jgi:hypothetical protein
MLSRLLGRLRSRVRPYSFKKIQTRPGTIRNDRDSRSRSAHPSVEFLEDRLAPAAWQRIEPLGSLMFQREESGIFGGNVAVYANDFESGLLGPEWTTFSSTAQGRVLVSNTLGTPAHSGAFHLVMDRTPAGPTTLNEAILSLNTSGLTDLTLNFWHKELGDEDQSVPSVFTGHVNGDAVSISTDGNTWHRIVDLVGPASTSNYTQYTVDLAAAAASAGLTLGPSLKIKFQQFDDNPVPADGHLFDDIQVTTTAPPVDITPVFLEGGQTLTVVATPDNPGSILTARVFSPSNLLLAQATASGPGQPVDLQTVSIASDGNYRVEVAGSAASSYSMTLYRNAAVEVGDTGDGSELDATGSLVELGSGRYGIVGSAGSQLPEPPPPPPGSAKPVVWAAQRNTGLIVKIDPATGSIIGSFPAPTPLLPNHQFVGLTIAEGGDSLLYVNGDVDGRTLYRLNPDTGAVLSTSVLPTTGNPQFRAGLSEENVPGAVPFIFALDDGAGLDRQSGFGGPIARHLTTPGTFPGAMGGDDNDRQFVAAGNGIQEYSPITPNTIIRTIPSPFSAPAGMAFDGTRLYVSDLEGSLVTLDPDTGAVLARLTIPGGGLIGLGAKMVGVTVPPPPSATELITNGDFESGNLTGWTQTNTGPASWNINNGTFDPAGNGTPLPPISGSFDAVAAQTNVSTAILSEPITVPTGITSATLSWSDRIRNFGNAFQDPGQEWRVVIRDANGGQIQQVFSTNPGDLLQQVGPNNRSFNLTSLLQSHAGQQIRVSFELQSTIGFFNATLDNVSLSVLSSGGASTTQGMYAAVGRGSPVNAGAVLLVDQTSGAGTLVGDPVTPGGLTGLDFMSDGTLWGSSIDGPLGIRVSNLVRINPDTGALISSVPIRIGSTPISVGDLAIQPGTNAIFGIHSNADQGQFPGGLLLRIDPSTGAATIIGPTGQNVGGGLAFAPDGTLYHIAFGLFTLNPQTGAVLTSRPLNVSGHDGLGVRPSDGALFAPRLGPAGGNEIHVIDPVAGTSTLLGLTGAGSVSDIAFRPATLPPPPPPAKPDVDEYTLDLEAGQTIDVAMSFQGEGPAPTQELIANGNFETGNFDGWIRSNSGVGSWVINNGAVDPEGPGSPRPPIAGNFDALARETGASTMTLVEPITIPSGITSAVLSWSDRILNFGTMFQDPNQEWRVVIRGATGAPIQEIFSTNAGDPLQQVGPNNRSFDVTSLLQSLAGQPIFISFELQNNLGFFNVNLDNVSLRVSTGEPAINDGTLELLAPDGETVLATAAPGADNFDQGILGFTVPTGGTYTLRFTTSETGKYAIVVTDSILFEKEPNSTTPLPLRSLNVIDSALGYLAGSDSSRVDTYSISLAAGETVGFLTDTPFDSPVDGLNTLDVSLLILNAGGGSILDSDQNGAPDGKNAFIPSFTAPSAGLYRVVVLTEPNGGAGEYVLTVNHAPIVRTVAVSAASIDENGSATVTGSFTDFDAADTHTAVVNWGDGSSSPATINPVTRTFTATHQYLDDGPSGDPSFIYPISVTVTDDGGLSGSGSTSVQVNNVDPVIGSIASSATFADKAEEGETVTVTAAFTDVGTLDTHEAVIDWGDGSAPEPAALTHGSGSGSILATHVYANGGVYTVTLTVIDDDTGTTVATTTAVVMGAGVNNGVLQVVGTDGDDQVTLNQQGNGSFNVHAGFFREGPFRTFDIGGVLGIAMYFGDGDDHVTIAGNIATPVILDGGAGDDRLNAGAGPAILLGGDGDDELKGGRGRSILIGGDGSDTLSGGTTEDILIGGFTDFDDDPIALLQLLEEWNSDRSYEERVDNLRTGAGPVLDGTGLLLAPDTVEDDGDVDLLSGTAGRDWFFLSPEAAAGDRKSNEEVG